MSALLVIGGIIVGAVAAVVGGLIWFGSAWDRGKPPKQ